MPQEGNPKELKLKMITAAGTAQHGVILYGLTEEGRVYQWGGESTGWVALSMVTGK